MQWRASTRSRYGSRRDVLPRPPRCLQDGSRGTANFRIKFDKSSKHQVSSVSQRGVAHVAQALPCCCIAPPCQPPMRVASVRASLPTSRGDSTARHHCCLAFSPQAYLNVEPVKGVTRAITGEDANEVRAQATEWGGSRQGAALCLRLPCLASSSSLATPVHRRNTPSVHVLPILTRSLCR